MVTYPKDWDYQSLGKCCIDKLSYGINAPAIPHSSQYPSYLRITDINDDGTYNSSDKKSVVTNEAEKYSLRSGDIVLARTGASTGKSYLYDERDGNFVYAGFLIKASVDEKRHNAKYIVSQLRTPRYWSWVASESMRSGQPGINGKQYSSFLIPVASKEEQDDIAETLSCIDTHVANLTELIEKKKGIRNGALEDLISGRTRLEGFNKPWKETTLGKEYNVIMGQSPSSSSYNSSKTGVPLVQGNADIENRVTAPQRYTTMPTKVCDIEDVIITVRAPVGTVSRANQTVCLGRGVCAINGINKEFIFHMMRYYESAWESIEQGSTFTAVSGKEVRKFEIVIPESDEQIAIASILTSMDTEIASLEEEKDKMLQIKAGAMDDLLTGQIRLAR